MWFRLNSAVSSPLNVRLPIREGGFTKYRYVSLVPGTDYEYPDELSGILLGFTQKQKYTKEREDALKAANCKYEIEHCKVCGGKRTNLVYHPIERA